ncbi:MAG: glycosyltransferase family 4 protein [Acidobacteriota bacterium]
MRFCHLAYSFYETDFRVRRYAELLAQRGHEVDVVALHRGNKERVVRLERVNVYRIQRRRVTESRAVGYLAKLLLFLSRSFFWITARHRRFPYDLIHVHNVPDFLVFAAGFPKWKGARVILDVHDLLPELYAGKFPQANNGRIPLLLGAVEKLSSNFADHVIVANDLWRDKLVARCVTPEKCTALLNYPDVERFRPRRARPANDGRFLLLYPGTLNRHQGVHLALEAFAKAADRMPGAEFHIYGEGPARPALERLAGSAPLAGRVTILDPIPLDEVARRVADADLGIIPKLAEGFGDEAFSTKSLEFMACGVPLVMSRTRIDSHYFDDSLVRFFPSGDVEALAEILVDEYRNRDTARERAARALEFARRESWQNRRQIYLDLVSRLTGKPV